MAMPHPNIIDRLKSKINPHHLYPGQLCQPVSNLNVAIVHRVSSARGGQTHWQIMDYLFIEKGSLLKYLGSGKQFNVTGDLQRDHSLFELIDVSTDKQIGAGDIIALNPIDRQFLTPAAPVSASDAKLPTYFTAEDQ